MELFGQSISVASAIFLILALLLALSFEFVNGFHDTANAVATVIYTNSLKPIPAVIWSGCWNLIGVLVSSGTVAYSVVALLPANLVMNAGSRASFAMVFALLISAIIWNVGTWFFGLPASSSHTLIGSILGVGLANALINGRSFVEGVNWTQVQSVFAALLFSPIVGFFASALLLLVLKATVKKPELFTPPTGESGPPRWIRALLVFTCTGVSFAHGSNDGQKGMGLLMLILIGILPGAFALQMGTSADSLSGLQSHSHKFAIMMQAHDPGVAFSSQRADSDVDTFLKTKGKANPDTYAALAVEANDLAGQLAAKRSLDQFSNTERATLRRDMYRISDSIAKLDKQKLLSKSEDKTAKAYAKGLDGVTKYIPLWVKVVTALALGFGTMIGWRRIVVTVGEKIGKQHLTYGQGASAELVAMGTIALATFYALPVSTTHILSSGIAGTMTANGSGLQKGTVRNIVLAWVLTLPVCVLLGALVFSATFFAILRAAGVH